MTSAPRLEPLDVRTRLAAARRRFTLTTASLVLLGGFVVGGLDLPYLADIPTAPGADDPAEGVEAEVEAREGNDLAADGPVEAAWPEADTQVFDLSSGPAAGELGGLPVTVAAVDGHSPDRVEVGILPADAVAEAGISGVVLAVAADGGEVEVAVDYASMAGYYGGSYGARLAAWELPGCAAGAAQDCAQDAVEAEAVNDGEAQTLTYRAQTTTAASPTLTALAAGEESDQGSYAATELAPSSEWSHGGASGAFQWSYGIAVPPVIGGLIPDITLSYSSQTSDGRTAATNNQGSWIGEGFTYEPGYIERSYQSCADDGHEDVAGAGDRCWATDNANIVLGGSSGDLVKDGDTWRISGDDGSKVERLTGAGNGDDDGEYWKVTTVDGTQYYFGRHELPGYASGDAVTDSTWTVPVFGDDSGEPCYDATFEDAYCDQAWRWNLDYVVDPVGAAMAYYYDTETNAYARHGETDVDGDAYTRGGYLDHIDYGLRGGDAYTTAPARVVFTTSERCLESAAESDCSAGALTDETAADWPDVPWDRDCETGTHCEATQSSPTFWTRKRLTGITTQVHTVAGYQSVDSWQLEHSWVSNADLTRTLWLDSITRTGKAGTGPDITLPPTTLLPVQKENRVDEIGDNISALIRPRLATVYTDTGGQIDITYAGEDCTPTDTPTPETNERRCFPVIWEPSSKDDKITDWFHKYVVTDIVVSDRTGAGPDQVTRYQYADPAWRHAQYKGIGDEDTFTWSEWRGYGTVTTVGAPDTTLETEQVTHYYQGMHGDDDGNGGTRSITLTDALGYDHTDYDQLSGRVLDQLTYDDGQVVSRVASSYWRHVTATDSHDWGELTAAFVREDTVRTDNLMADGTYRRTVKDSDYDSTYGLVAKVDDFRDSTTSADNQCTRTEYARNTGDYLVNYAKRVETVAVGCDATPDRTVDVVSDVRTSYDGGDYGDAPTEGLATSTEEIETHDGITASYVTTASKTYDDYGREWTVTDAAGNDTVKTYTDSNGRNTGTTVTNALGHVTTTVFDTTRHLETAVTDPNGKATEQVYDSLGRVTEVWMPYQDRTDSSQTPHYRFGYNVSDTAPTAVTTEQIVGNGPDYAESVEIFDGLLRARQTQTTGPGSGRLITDTMYDALGRTAETREPYYADGAPSGTLLLVDSGEADLQTITEYDDLDRATAVITAEAGQELWRSTTEYWADHVTVTAPEGGIATTTFNNTQGQTTELRQYYSNTPTSQYNSTTYAYTPAGAIETVTDPEGNTWSFEYDQRGRKTRAVDPDTGETTYTYDVLGNLTSTTDARERTVSTVYDELSRAIETWEGQPGAGTQLTRRVWDNVFIGYETGSVAYDDGLEITKVTDRRNWDYQPITERVYVEGEAAGALAGTYSTSTGYYLDGSTSGRTWAAAGGLDGEQLAYERDRLGRVTGVAGTDGVYADNVSYEPNGLIQSALYPTGAATLKQTWIYGEANRLTKTWTEADDRVGSLTEVAYDYDDAGNLQSVVDDPTAENGRRQAECYVYDGLRRLTEAWTTTVTGTDAAACTSGPEATGVTGAAAYWQSYTFDGAGNRTGLTVHDTTGTGSDQTWTYTYGTQTAHALESVTDTTTGETSAFSYDATGNTTAVTSSTGFTQDLTWGADGSVKSITTNGAAGSSAGAVSGEVRNGTVDFAYDADGARILREGADEATLYVAGVEITLDKSAGTLYSTRTVDLPGGATRIESTGNQAQIQIADHHGTGSLAFDCQTGEATRRYSDPYGNNLATTTTAASGDPVWLGQNGYVGGTIDPTGYTHIGVRDYNPTTGRFLSVDPIADWVESQHLNGYAYSNNNPITFRDDTGLFWDDIGDAIGSATDAVVDAADTVADAAVDVGQWTADKAKDVGKWTYDNAGNIATVASTVATAATIATAVCPPCGVVTAPLAAGATAVAWGASALDTYKAFDEGNTVDGIFGLAGFIPAGKTLGGILKFAVDKRGAKNLVDSAFDGWQSLWNTSRYQRNRAMSKWNKLRREYEGMNWESLFSFSNPWGRGQAWWEMGIDTLDLVSYTEGTAFTVCQWVSDGCNSRQESYSWLSGSDSGSSGSGGSGGSSSGSSGSAPVQSSDGRWYLDSGMYFV